VIHLRNLCLRQRGWFSIIVVTVTVALALGVNVPAYTQEPPGGVPAQDSSKITVTKRAYDTKLLVAPPALSESALRGRRIWLQRCSYCHDGVGQPSYNTMGPWLGADTFQSLPEPAFKALVAAGTVRMPGFRYALKSQQMDDVIAFLKTVSSEKRPTPAQLAGKAAGPVVGGD
jgi:mono/diheme cytochrome c family protein